MLEFSVLNWSNNSTESIRVYYQETQWVFEVRPYETAPWEMVDSLDADENWDFESVLAGLKERIPNYFKIDPFQTITLIHLPEFFEVSALNCFEFLTYFHPSMRSDLEIYRPFWKEYGEAISKVGGLDLWKIVKGRELWVAIPARENAVILPVAEYEKACEEPLARLEYAEAPLTLDSRIIAGKYAESWFHIALESWRGGEFLCTLLSPEWSSLEAVHGELISVWLNELLYRPVEDSDDEWAPQLTEPQADQIRGIATYLLVTGNTWVEQKLTIGDESFQTIGNRIRLHITERTIPERKLAAIMIAYGVDGLDVMDRQIVSAHVDAYSLNGKVYGPGDLKLIEGRIRHIDEERLIAQEAIQEVKNISTDQVSLVSSALDIHGAVVASSWSEFWSLANLSNSFVYLDLLEVPDKVHRPEYWRWELAALQTPRGVMMSGEDDEEFDFELNTFDKIKQIVRPNSDLFD